MRHLVSLDGLWCFTTGTDTGAYASPQFDDTGWDRIHVPAHWHLEGYPYYSGEAWYRVRFPTPALAPEESCALRFDAVDYQARVWLNGACLGEHEGYFAPLSFNVTPYLLSDRENVLAVQVLNPSDVRRVVKGALMRWDCADPRGNPGGIWQSVHLLGVAPTEFGAIRVHTTVLSDDHVILHLSVDVTRRGEPTLASLRVQLAPTNFEGRAYAFEKQVGVYPGKQTLTFDFDLQEARLWWTWDWGHPSLYVLKLQLAVSDGQILALKEQTCGLREVTRGDRWAVFLNQRHIFLRGANYLSDQFMSSMTPERYRQDLELARGANVNAFRPFGNVERPDFYRLCDEYGMAVTQYLSIQYSYHADADYVRRASGVLAEMVALLDPHPSVITWIMNGEPDEPTNRDLDRPLAELCRTLDPSRIVQVASHPVQAQPMLNEDPSMHDWLAKFCHYTGVLGRDSGHTGSHSQVGELGQQSLPGVEMLQEIGVTQLWPLDWDAIIAHNGFRDELLQFETENPQSPESIGEVIERTQRFQGELIRYFIDHFRCHRYTRCNALFQFHFADCWPAVTWSVLDYRRRPKLSYAYLQEAFSPINLVPDCPPVFCLSEEMVDVPIYLVNDTPVAVSGYQGYATVCDSAGTVLVEQRWPLTTGANVSIQVGVLQWQLPRVISQETLTLNTSLSDADGRQVVCHRYRVLVCSSYAVPLADPQFARRDWSWYRSPESRHAVEYVAEGGRTFARFHGGGAARLTNRVPVRGVTAGEHLAVSLLARSTAAEGATDQLVLQWEATEPVEMNPSGELSLHGPVGSPCWLEIPGDGMWHTIRSTLAVPECRVGWELHLGFHATGDSTADIANLKLVRSSALTSNSETEAPNSHIPVRRERGSPESTCWNGEET